MIQAINDGPYTRAFQKRGAGLHHIAVDVTDAEEFAHNLAGSGWLLHPSSLHTLKSSRTLWLARPGLPALVEVQERESLSIKPAFISRIRMPALSQAHEKMLHTLGVTQACAENDDGLTLVIQNQKLRLSDII